MVDANASGRLDMIGLGHPAFARPPPLATPLPARPLLDTDPGGLACNVTGAGYHPAARLGHPRPG